MFSKGRESICDEQRSGRRVSTSLAALHSAVCWCLSMRGTMLETQICAALHKNEHDPATVGTLKKTCFCAHLVLTEIEWFQSVIAIFWRKIFRKKKRKIPRKCCHWVIPLFKSRDDIFAERCTFFFENFIKIYGKS